MGSSPESLRYPCKTDSYHGRQGTRKEEDTVRKGQELREIFVLKKPCSDFIYYLSDPDENPCTVLIPFSYRA